MTEVRSEQAEEGSIKTVDGVMLYCTVYIAGVLFLLILHDVIVTIIGLCTRSR